MQTKSTPEEIRQRFDNDVERFSNLETGQSATMDAPLVLELIVQAAATATPGARRSLDVGCGAGNYTLKLLEALPDLDVDLLDLSRPMLDRAVERIAPVARGRVTPMQGDLREVPFEADGYDIIMAAATLHHLRGDDEWESVFRKLHAALRPGGSLWISDLVEHTRDAVQRLMWRRYGEYLTGLRDEAYREHVFDYIAKEDSPRPLMYQLDLLRAVGFAEVDVLHKNGCFAAFAAFRD